MDAELYPVPLFRLSGDRALLVEFGTGIDDSVNAKVLAMDWTLRADPIPGIISLIPSYCSLAVLYDPMTTNPLTLEREILRRNEGIVPFSGVSSDVVTIPVCYDEVFSPDMDTVRQFTQLNREDIIAIHTGRDYPIFMIGFTPGFCYLGGMDERLRTPRRETPRLKIPAGSVGIAEMQTGMYPVESPGGWQIIGRTPLRLFVPQRESPFIYKVGDRIRFHAISMEEFDRIRAGENN